MQQEKSEQQPLLEHSGSPNVGVSQQPLTSPSPKPVYLYEPPPTTSRHWLVLSMACLLLVGNYYCYDLPAALNVQLKEWLGTDAATHQYQLNLLYSAYSFPNIVLPLLGGFLVDRLSASKMILVFSICICTGQALFLAGVATRSFVTMAFGRLVFGIGGECLEVAQCKITTDWFKEGWLGFALGLNLSSARTATALNDNVSPWIEYHTRGRWYGGVVGASSMGLATCLISFGCGIALSVLDRPESRSLSGVKIDKPKNIARLNREERYREHREDENRQLAYEYDDDARSSGRRSCNDNDDDDDEETQIMMAEDDKMLISEIWTLQPSFWILCLCCITLYGAVVPFFHILSDFLQQRWYPNDPQRAGAVMSLPDIISAVGSPLCGLLVDRFGHRSRYIPLSAIFLIWAHAQLGFSLVTPLLGMSVMGLSYSLFASVLWPCIPFLVQDEQLGTAYGIVTIALNISLTVFPIVVAWLLHQSKGNYQEVEVLFITLAVLGLFLSILLNVLDEHRAAGKLEDGFESPTSPFSPSPLPTTVYSPPPSVHPLQGEYPEGRSMLPSEFQARLRQHTSAGQEGQRQRRRRRSSVFSAPRLSDDHGRVTSIEREHHGRITTRSVGCDGVVAIIPHHSQRQRRHSTTVFSSHLEQARKPRQGGRTRVESAPFSFAHGEQQQQSQSSRFSEDGGYSGESAGVGNTGGGSLPANRFLSQRSTLPPVSPSPPSSAK